MSKHNNAKDNIQVLSKQEKKVFEKILNNLIQSGWDSIIEFDPSWGWLILATYSPPNFGVTLRRIKPFPLNSLSDFDRALKLQARLRNDLIEVLPYKIFLGNKISLSPTNKPFEFLAEADIEKWTKFFRSRNFSLKTQSIGVPENLASDLLVGVEFLEAINE